MYQGPPIVTDGPSKGTTVTASGAGFAFTGYLAWGLVLIVLGMMIIGLTQWGPRFAIEPVLGSNGKYRLRLTRNGKPRK